MPGKPWRTIIGGEQTGRFTRSQIEAAVEAVKAEEGKRRRAPATPSTVPAHPDRAASDLASEYARMAADDDREAEARAWADALLPDVSDDEG
jgi:hypothetical protein